MDCETFREGVSASLDGEAPGLPAEALERHLAQCASCRAWRAAAETLTRSVRLGPAEPIPDLTADILAAARLPADQGQRRWARVGLAAVALAQLGLALPGLLFGADVAASLHVAHELASWEVALAVGFLVAAARPARAWGMLPLVAALVACLVTTSLLDLSDGHAGLGETSHVLEVVGLGCLWALAGRIPARSRLRAA